MLACFDNKSVDNSQYNKDAGLIHLPSPNWMTLFSSLQGRYRILNPLKDSLIFVSISNVSLYQDHVMIIYQSHHHHPPYYANYPKTPKQKQNKKNIMSRLKLVQAGVK